jgi:hypothetical protein
MTQRLHTAEITLNDAPLRAEQEHALLQSPNAMSAFIHIGLDSLPPSTYLPAYRNLHFIGAVHIEENPFNDIVTIHPMLIERNRAVFTEVTEAAILWCINNHWVPTAHVLHDPKYDYMHEFLKKIGMLRGRIENGFRYYNLPSDWRPTSFTSYTMEFA